MFSYCHRLAAWGGEKTGEIRYPFKHVFKVVKGCILTYVFLNLTKCVFFALTEKKVTFFWVILS